MASVGEPLFSAGAMTLSLGPLSLDMEFFDLCVFVFGLLLGIVVIPMWPRIQAWVKSSAHHSKFSLWEGFRSQQLWRNDSVIQMNPALKGSVEKVCVMSELLEDMCMVVAVGPQLQIVTMNDGLKNLLRIDQVPGAKMPKYVDELVPESVRAVHRKWVAKAFVEGSLPESLMHPLRSVGVQRADGSTVRCDISIGTMSEGVDMPTCPFYAILTPVPGEDDDSTENWRRAAAYIYGANVTMLYLDVVGFTKSCASRSPSEVARWMAKVHTMVENQISAYSVRKIETRGDCYVCVTGTNAVDGDLSSTQMSRMVGFATEVCTGLRKDTGTDIRVGIAFGPVTIAYIGTNQFVPTMCAFGHTMNTAASMESSGKAGYIHMTREAAEQFVEEGKHFYHKELDFSASLHEVETKSQGLQSAVWYDGFAQRFDGCDEN